MKKNTFTTIMILIVALTTSYGQEFINGMKRLEFDKAITEDKAINSFLTTNSLSKENTFRLIRTTKDRSGYIHNRYQQYYKGIKVEFGTLITHKKGSVVKSINAEIYDASKISLTPTLSKVALLQKSVENLDVKRASWYNNSTKVINSDFIDSELVIIADYNNNSNTVVLAYKFDISASEPMMKGNYYINAQDGSSVIFNNKLKHFHRDLKNSKAKVSGGINGTKVSNSILADGMADTRNYGQQSIQTRLESNGTYTLNDDTNKIYTRNAINGDPNTRPYYNNFVDFQDNDNNWTAAEHNNIFLDDAALDAHYSASKVREYWSTVHNRNSFDDNGAPIISYVHVGSNYSNAFWDGSAMSYGDGNSNPLSVFDIAAHEIGHAVTDFTSDLVYANQSGGLNEGFSDIWGAAIQHYAYGTGTDAAPDDNVWAIGEDIGAIRSMSTPKSFNNPDTYLGTFWRTTADEGSCVPSQGNDNCGVHINSGVLNHWFYITVIGKSGTNDAGNSYNVSGIGMIKSEEIAYLMLRDYLTPNSTFLEARNIAIEITENLYGCNSSELITVQNAWYAVNVGEEFINANNDVSVSNFVNTGINVGCDNVAPPITLSNKGANSINSVDLTYTIDGGTPVNETISVSISSCETTEYNITSIGTLSPGQHTMEVTTTIANDERPNNNTTSFTFYVNSAAQENTLNDFENPNNVLISYNDGNVNESLWERGIPTGTLLQNASNNVYGTNLDGNHPNMTKAYLVSQCYDLSQMSDPALRFDMAFDLESDFDILYMEYTLDSGESWNILGTANDPNWYNSDRTNQSSGAANDCQNCPGAQWTGEGELFGQGGTRNATLKTYSYLLSDFGSNSASPATNIIFRFTFVSDPGVVEEGVIIDNFIVGEQSLGTEDNDVFDAFSYSPNPSNGLLNVAFTPKAFDQDILINVYDLSGRNVYTKSFKPSANFTVDLNLELLNTGMYVMDIQQGDNNQYAKIIMK